MTSPADRKSETVEQSSGDQYLIDVDTQCERKRSNRKSVAKIALVNIHYNQYNSV